jgi:transcriptional regulator with XRE-family HTH domain
MNDPNSIGPTLRRLRMQRNASLAAIAEQARISVATLSRIETNKQSIEIGLLLTLARVLGVPAAHLVGGDAEIDVDTLAAQLAALPPDARAKVVRKSSPARQAKDLQPVLDELISGVDMLREQLLDVQRAMRRRRNGRGFHAVQPRGFP